MSHNVERAQGMYYNFNMVDIRPSDMDAMRLIELKDFLRSKSLMIIGDENDTLLIKDKNSDRLIAKTHLVI